VHPLTAEDATLLRDPTAAAVWALLRQRYPDCTLDLDIDLSLDLGMDSFAWMELTILLQDRVRIRLSDTDIAGIATIRDLLCRSIERRTEVGPRARTETAVALDIERWLAPTGALLTALGFVLYALNRLVMRGLFRLQFAGVEGLPETGPLLIAPNHVSYLDAPAIAAALPWRRVRQIYWAGDVLRLFSNPLSRLLSRAMHLFPVDSRHPGAALEIAMRVLRASNALVWFPEGWRSPDGSLQRFLPGVGQLLVHTGAPAVPAYITGTFEAWPRGRRIPRFHHITVTFGHPAPMASLRASGIGRTDEERAAKVLRQRLLALDVDTDGTAEPVPCPAAEPCPRRAGGDPCSGPYLSRPRIERDQRRPRIRGGPTALQVSGR
jgi:long-chain acyl-CoA synthetase